MPALLKKTLVNSIRPSKRYYDFWANYRLQLEEILYSASKKEERKQNLAAFEKEKIEQSQTNYLIFDFDGVLGNTHKIFLKFLENNAPAQTQIQESGFKNAEEFTDHMMENPQRSKEYIQLFFQDLQDFWEEYPLPLFTDFLAEIAKIPNKRLAVVSSNCEKAIVTALDLTKVEFDHISGFEKGGGKVQKIEQICAAWQVQKENIYYFTDTVGDVLELEEFLGKDRLVGCSWGWHGGEKLLKFLPQKQLLQKFSDVESFLLSQKWETKTLSLALYDYTTTIVRENILYKGKRLDGRAVDKTRQISCQVGVLPRTHGSSLFNRGETQVLNVLTLGTSGDAQTLDDMEDFEETTKRYIHHYNFPSYSVGETGRYTGASRREIGHGALAEKALLPVLPSEDKFPYTMRLVSECLGSNGSTSMASTCASCLSLLDGGVPITDLVAGVAMGLVVDTSGSTTNQAENLEEDILELEKIQEMLTQNSEILR